MLARGASAGGRRRLASCVMAASCRSPPTSAHPGYGRPIRPPAAPNRCRDSRADDRDRSPALTRLRRRPRARAALILMLHGGKEPLDGAGRRPQRRRGAGRRRCSARSRPARPRGRASSTWLLRYRQPRLERRRRPGRRRPLGAGRGTPRARRGARRAARPLDGRPHRRARGRRPARASAWSRLAPWLPAGRAGRRRCAGKPLYAAHGRRDRITSCPRHRGLTSTARARSPRAAELHRHGPGRPLPAARRRRPGTTSPSTARRRGCSEPAGPRLGPDPHETELLHRESIRAYAVRDETKPFRFIRCDRTTGTPHDPAPTPPPRRRPRVEGDREQEILDATLEVLAEVGYDRLTMDAVATAAKASRRRSTGAGTARSAWSSTRCCSPKSHARRCPTPAPCAATCSRRSAASAASPTSSAVATLRQRASPRSAATPSSPRRSARDVVGPKSPPSPHDLRARPRPRRDPRRRRPRPARPGARRDRPAPPVPAGRAARRGRSSRASSTRSSCPPPGRHRRPAPHRPRRHDPKDMLMTDLERRPRTRAPGDAARHLGWALVLISIAQLMVVLDAHHRQHRPALHRQGPRHRPAPT